MVLPTKAPDSERSVDFQYGDFHRLAANGSAGVGALRRSEVEKRLVQNGLDEAVPERVQRQAKSENVFRGGNALLALGLREVKGLLHAINGDGVHSRADGSLVDERTIRNCHGVVR